MNDNGIRSLARNDNAAAMDEAFHEAQYRILMHNLKALKEQRDVPREIWISTPAGHVLKQERKRGPRPRRHA